MTLPLEYQNQMQTLLGAEYLAYLESLNQPPHFGLRVNTQKITPSRLQQLYSGDLAPVPYTPLATVPWCDYGFYYEKAQRPAKNPLYAAGLYYLQEPSAMSSASIIDIQPGHKVLDLCAAPGGKSTQAAARLNGQGLLVSNDVSATRCKALLKNLELWGTTNSAITNEQPERLAARFPNYFDRILVDAPCSGEGMFRKDADAVKSWSIAKQDECRELQRSILHYAARMLAPGGQIIYSTCTFAPRENEDTITEFLEKNADFSLLPIDCKRLGLEEGFIPGCARIWPHKQNGEGHFLALLTKAATPLQETPPLMENIVKPIKEISYFHEFCEHFLNSMPGNPNGLYELHGETLFLIPPELPSLAGLRVMRGGFYLGDLKTKRFEPSQALAMGITQNDAKQIIDFPLASEWLVRYLKGESFEWDAADGWNLVCVEGYPIGWAKAKDGRLKNKYPKGWVTN